MSAFSASHDSWLSLKHRTKPSCVYSFACGERDSDWDFADTPSRGYSFRSEDNPIQLLNNSGGMDDEEDAAVRDVWYPHQQATAATVAPVATEEADSEMSDSQSDDMDMDMGDNNQHVHQQQYFQQQPQQFAQQPQQHNAANTTVNKRKRGAESLEMNSGMAAYEYQQMSFDGSKRVRVGA